MKIPVVYVGLQKTLVNGKDFHLVNEPNGSTKVYDPDKHEIVGTMADEVPEELTRRM